MRPAAITLSLALFAAAIPAVAQDDQRAGQDASEKQPATVRVFDALTLTIPTGWEPQPPKSRIIEHEFVVTTGEGENAPTARVTMMAAGGDVAQNIDRWKGQFADGGQAKVEKIQAEGRTIHLVELDGTFKDSMGGGPFSGGKTVMREDYGMLGAIIEMKDGRKYFVKLTGPREVVESQRKDFKAMLKNAQG